MPENKQPRGGEGPAGLSHIDSWVFDLDNTLYPASSGLFPQIDARMGGFIADMLGLSPAEARKLQKQYYREYGTTLRGLMTLHGVDPLKFLHYVHDIDYAKLEPDPAMAAALSGLAGRKAIFTNGDQRHAERVLDRLGLTSCFDGVFDIVAANYVPKPEGESYDAMLEALSLDPKRAAMFEDLARNLEPAKERGMVSILVREPGMEPEFPEGETPWVDYVATDLARWLSSLSKLA